MFGFINATASRQKKNGFSFLPLNRDYPSPSHTITAPGRASSHTVSTITGLDAATKGMALMVRLFNSNWGYGANEMIFSIGNTNDYIYFQKRKSGYKFRWGLVSGSVIQLIDEFSVDYLYDGHITIGASVAPDEIRFCVNGVTISHQTTGITLPNISSTDTIEVGQFFGASQPANPSVIFDWVKVWDKSLSSNEIENATFEYTPLNGVSFDENLWTVIKAGQSNSKANGNCVAPASYAPTNPTQIKMITKDLTVRPYADPYSTLAYGNILTAFDDVGGFNAVGVTIDRLVSRYNGKTFAAMALNRGGSGLVHENGAGKWSNSSSALVTTGNASRISAYALAGYLSMLIARQHGHVLALEWYQGETDGVDGSNVTGVEYNTTLASLFDQWRLVLPPIRIIVGLGDVPSTGFSNWGAIQAAQASFSYANTHYITAEGLEVQLAEDYHLTGQGQYDLGILAAQAIIKANS